MREQVKPFLLGGYMTPELAKSLWDYDSESGFLYWKIRRGHVHKGTKITCVPPHGYVCVMFNKRGYLVHRIAWMIYYGRIPNGQIDHINRITTDNRICNLRDVSHGENRRNSKVSSNSVSKLKGASMDKRTGRYRSYITADGKDKYLGTFDTAEEAHNRYLEEFSILYAAPQPGGSNE